MTTLGTGVFQNTRGPVPPADRATRAAGRYLEKRSAALALLTWFMQRLPGAAASSTVTALVQDTKARVDQLQGADSEKPYLARTVCRISTALRRAGWIGDAIDILEWARERGAEDPFVFGELIHCLVRRGEIARAETILAQAERRSRVTSALYASMITGYGHANDVRRAEAVYQRASSRNMVDAFAAAAMARAYARVGDAEAARAILQSARARGHVTAGLYNAAISACLRGCQWSSALELLADAKSDSAVDSRTYKILIRGCFEHCRPDEADALFQDAHRECCVDGDVHRALIHGYVLVGYLGQAVAAFRRACSDGQMSQGSYVVLIEALRRKGQFRRARRVRLEARRARVIAHSESPQPGPRATIVGAHCEIDADSAERGPDDRQPEASCSQKATPLTNARHAG